ncbi:hypothetical protein Adeg_0698 [Ammonifex degensii KC4]|uniref:DUF2642 domain-containing protein n=1 Tax=Ammonifex degensii (strain DSM 10501 / KC4) TaxID=429009 RepID=C9RC68_AMMDK|nr:hypothetical protein [Ammonifex degensii]ACX51845.1 hypothetical protein Adeg_0698 [Ammonifex degensii KC4]
MLPTRTPTHLREILSSFSPGDRLLVSWKNVCKDSTTRPTTGTVVDTTDRLVVLRSPEGFHFCVSLSDLASGVTLRKARGGRS